MRASNKVNSIDLQIKSVDNGYLVCYVVYPPKNDEWVDPIDNGKLVFSSQKDLQEFIIEFLMVHDKKDKE